MPSLCAVLGRCVEALELQRRDRNINRLRLAYDCFRRRRVPAGQARYARAPATQEARGLGGERFQLFVRIWSRRVSPLVDTRANVQSIAGSLFVLVYFLPIYFQAVRGSSAVGSGLRNLALIVPVCKYEPENGKGFSQDQNQLTPSLPAICTILIGGLITRFGHFAHFMLCGAIAAATGCGLIYRFDQTTRAGEWIGYQIFTGVGFGVAFQTPIMAAQALAAQRDVATTTAILYCKFSHVSLSRFRACGSDQC